MKASRFPAILLLLALAACGRGMLSRDDANAPTGWAVCENLEGGTFALTGGAKDSSRGVEGRQIVLVSDGADMRPAIEAAIRDYDIIVLDGSQGPFLYSESSYFEGLRNKTIVGVNGAVIRTAFQFTPELQEAVKHAGERYDGAVPEPGGRFRLSNDSLARNFAGYAMIETLMEHTGDRTMRFMRSGVWAFLHGCGNLIIRNLFFDGPGTIRGKPDTMIRLRHDCDHVWIDHCTFEDPGCLALGITKRSDCVTVSWCEFRFTGQSNGHSLGVLISSSDEDWEDEDFLNVTFDHCLWSDVWSRIPMARFGTVHVLDNCFDCPGTVGINPRQNAEFLVEGCWFSEGVKPFCDYRIDVAPPKAYVFRDSRCDPQFELPSSGQVSVPYGYDVTSPERSRDEVRAFAGPTLRDPLRIRPVPAGRRTAKGVSTPGHGQGEGPAGDKRSQTAQETVGGAGAEQPEAAERSPLAVRWPAGEMAFH